MEVVTSVCHSLLIKNISNQLGHKLLMASSLAKIMLYLGRQIFMVLVCGSFGFQKISASEKWINLNITAYLW